MEKIKAWFLKRKTKRRNTPPLGTPAEHFARYPGARLAVIPVVAKMPVIGEEKAQ